MINSINIITVSGVQENKGGKNSWFHDAPPLGDPVVFSFPPDFLLSCCENLFLV